MVHGGSRPPELRAADEYRPRSPPAPLNSGRRAAGRTVGLHAQPHTPERVLDPGGGLRAGESLDDDHGAGTVDMDGGGEAAEAVDLGGHGTG